MPRSRTVMRYLTRVTTIACCTTALAITQVVQAHADSRTVSFDYTHLWTTPEFDTGGGPVHFTVKKCNRPNKDMTVRLRRTDGLNYDVDSQTIKCQAGSKVIIDVGKNPAGTYEFELGKLDDGTHFKGTATYSFTSPR
ncbi:hypothetical protein [Streptomyces sp. NPDC004658]|uniref:hypothetical protein n=1 Tax=Streptomyces sp. NPDC004658 TaxID=3154672 RepID=UPI0033BD462D